MPTRKHRYFLGIDPGASGGLALIDGGDGPKTFRTMPDTLEKILAWILSLDGSRTIAVVEQVGGYVKPPTGNDNPNRQPGHTMFTFGRNVGAIEMALVAAGIPHVLVHPRTWQKAVGVPPGPKGETETARKTRIKRHADELFPDVFLTKRTCDAMLIAHYCRTHAAEITRELGL